MKRLVALYHWASVTSAVLLVSGFIAYQSGVFDNVLGIVAHQKAKLFSGSKSYQFYPQHDVEPTNTMPKD